MGTLIVIGILLALGVADAVVGGHEMRTDPQGRDRVERLFRGPHQRD